MLQLHARLSAAWDGEPRVFRISSDPAADESLRHQQAFLVPPGSHDIPQGFGAYLAIGNSFDATTSGRRVWSLPHAMAYLASGDVVRFSGWQFSVLYRRQSLFNSLLLTEQCNSNCLMCSQPPKAAADHHLADAVLEAIPLIDPSTGELGLTGGEPTLLGPRLLQIIEMCRCKLPTTALHLLSNGRLFNYLSLCQDLASIDHPDLVIGIPLYSDIASQHDFVVQASGAFDQTVRGIMNLERCGLRVEVRVVLHQSTVNRLPQLAAFIARNLPFVEHVALMGLEMMGYARLNLDALWVDPIDYQSELSDSVKRLVNHGMCVSIYNLQLCTLRKELWPYAKKSISDWKNEYIDACTECGARTECGGFFSSADLRRSAHISPIRTGYDEAVGNLLAYH